MIRYIARRLLWMIPVLLGVSFLVFVLLAIAPGDPATTNLGQNASVEDIARFNQQNGLDLPIVTRYVRYLYRLLTQGDFGNSYSTTRPVRDLLMERLGVTLQLSLSSLFVVLLVGIPLGIISAIRQYSILDHAGQVLSLVFVSMPNFWLGILFIIFFAVNLKILPASGWNDMRYWILPALTSGLSGAAGMMRTTRSSMLDVTRQDYIKTARAKGQSEWVVVRHHMLRNALLPIITVIGTSIGMSLGNAMTVETIFSIPGLSKLMIDSIYKRDYPVVQGAVFLIALICTIINLLVDLAYAAIDPRIAIQFKNDGKRKIKKPLQQEGLE